MNNMKSWCSNKENIKIICMVGLAIVLVVVLIHRFSAKAVNTSDSPAAEYQRGMEPLTGNSAREYKTRMPERTPSRSKKVMFNGVKPPALLKRDLFASRNTGNSPKRTTEQIEAVHLELTATIIDGAGALAIIGNEVLGMGDRVKGMRVTAIKENEVTLSKGKRQYVLRIKDE